MTPRDTARQYFVDGRVMQIGTLHDGLARVNSVYYVPASDYTAVYWMSEPRRRHSQDVALDGRMSAAIAIKTSWPVAGLQCSGRGSVVDDNDELQVVIDRYNAVHHDAAKGLYERIQNNTNKHLIYKLTIESLELFDGVNFPDDDVLSIPLG